MDVGVFHLVGVIDGVEHRARLLRRGAVVEIDQRLAVDLAEQDREIGADRLDVVGAPPALRSVSLTIAVMIASSAASAPHQPSAPRSRRAWRSADSASRRRSSSTLSIASPMKLSISSARASASGMPRERR